MFVHIFFIGTHACNAVFVGGWCRGFSPSHSELLSMIFFVFIRIAKMQNYVLYTTSILQVIIFFFYDLFKLIVSHKIPKVLVPHTL